MEETDYLMNNLPNRRSNVTCRPNQRKLGKIAVKMAVNDIDT